MSSPINGTCPASAADPNAVAEYKKQKDRIHKATQDFEAVFIGMMLKQMRKSMTSNSSLLGNSQESKTYQEMMDDTISTHLSQSGTFGLAKVMNRSLEKTLPPDPEAIKPKSTLP